MASITEEYLSNILQNMDCHLQLGEPSLSNIEFVLSAYVRLIYNGIIHQDNIFDQSMENYGEEHTVYNTVKRL